MRRGTLVGGVPIGADRDPIRYKIEFACQRLASFDGGSRFDADRQADGSYTLILVTDNDFSVTQNGAGTQFDVCTSGVNGTGTTTQVSLGAGCPAGSTLIPNMIYSVRLSEAEYRSLTAAVPEPATWGMMVLGFGLIGAAARRRGTMRVRYA